VRDLAVSYRDPRGGWTPAVEGLGFAIGPGEALGVLGESGCGKTTTALAIPGLLAANGRVTGGSVQLAGRELTGLSERRLEGVRGAGLGLVTQEPSLALNPVIRVGEAVAEVLRVHRGLSWKLCREVAARGLAAMGFPDPGRIAASYPHQLSGGERQRVTLARALICEPPVLIADEPTASLDAPVAVEILALLRDLKARRRLALLLISHDPRVLAALADRVLVLRDGRVVEEGPCGEVFRHPRHPYTAALLRSLPPSLASLESLPSLSPLAEPAPLLEVRGLRKTYALRQPLGARHRIAALNGVDLALAPAARLALIGRSGSGKSTLARCLALLEEPDGGEIRLRGEDLERLPRRRRESFRPELQLVFQDPAAALNPRFSALQAVEEPLRLQRTGGGAQARREAALGLLAQVGLSPELAGRPVPRLSGGQKRRLLLARALATRPRVLVLDEPFAGLDLPLQAQIADLLRTLQEAHGFAMVLVSHDLDMAGALAGEVAVMDGGRIVERAAPAELLARPRQPASRELVAAARALQGTLQAFQPFQGTAAPC
jgi:ABC-type glutathione transport system ATPase component